MMFNISFLLITFLILFVIYQNCNIEGLDKKKKKNKNCKDDPTWFVTDKGGQKHYCNDIGISASCYDYDAAGRDGWERCFKTCGVCENSSVSKIPMNVLATFSGDPIEDFGVVLHMDSSRDWVGKQDKKGKDVRDTIIKNKELKEDISTLTKRLGTMEDIFSIISGNVVKCKDKKISKTSKEGKFYGCRGQLLNCPSPGENNNIKHQYIKHSDGSIQFPAQSISCGEASKLNCDDYFLFNKITKKTKDLKESNKVTLGDMCPIECKVPNNCNKKK